jgi:ribosome-associated protein
MDYGDVVVHLFDAETRRHYRLEELWADAAALNWRGRTTA